METHSTDPEKSGNDRGGNIDSDRSVPKDEGGQAMEGKGKGRFLYHRGKKNNQGGRLARTHSHAGTSKEARLQQNTRDVAKIFGLQESPPKRRGRKIRG